MNEAKHTPPPWAIRRSPGRTTRLWIAQANDKRFTIAAAFDQFVDEEVAQANAELIVTSVNARPKVEELVRMILSKEGNGHLRYMPPENCAALDKKAREIEAALGGKAE